MYREAVYLDPKSAPYTHNNTGPVIIFFCASDSKKNYSNPYFSTHLIQNCPRNSKHRYTEFDFSAILRYTTVSRSLYTFIHTRLPLFIYSKSLPGRKAPVSRVTASPTDERHNS
ncbi:hypothetical protein ABW19_dt0201589 [Dactylella cylindrospora]|nr:hypothetical protein ABW19_dt0201589 [Dactylella cylindrospora]